MVTTPFFPIPLYTIALGNYSRLLHMTQVGNTAFFATDCSFARQTPFLVLTANSWLKRYTKTQTNRAGIDCCWLHVSGYCVISGFTSNCLMNKRDCSLLLIDCIQLSSSLIPSLSLSLSLSRLYVLPLSKHSFKYSQEQLIICMCCVGPSEVRPVIPDLCTSGW